MHVLWVRAVAGRIREDPRYSTAICYNCFPLPTLDTARHKELSLPAERVLVARERHPEKNIAQLYDPDNMPADLLAAHRELDVTVERCYRTKPFTSDDERLEYLFGLYEQLTSTEDADTSTPAKGTKAKKAAEHEHHRLDTESE